MVKNGLKIILKQRKKSDKMNLLTPPTKIINSLFKAYLRLADIQPGSINLDSNGHWGRDKTKLSKCTCDGLDALNEDKSGPIKVILSVISCQDVQLLGFLSRSRISTHTRIRLMSTGSFLK